jgi:hypothetical protein
MTWDDARAALQLLTEERLGRAVRATRAAEDGAFAAASAGFREH